MIGRWIRKKVAKVGPPCTCSQALAGCGLECPDVDCDIEYRANEANPPIQCDPIVKPTNTLATTARAPILQPNELLLQRFPQKRSVFRLSAWKAQEARMRCRRCTSGESSMSMSSEYSDDLSPLEDIGEADPENIVTGSERGSVYVTTERIVFIPESSSSQGFALLIERIDNMKALNCSGVWYFVCYQGNKISSIPFTTEQRTRSFLKLISNIRFENMVRHCLPPKYSPNTWEEADAMLPSYSESEAAVRLYLVSRGLLEPGSSLDRQEPEAASLIALAAAPPSEDYGNAAAQGLAPRRRHRSGSYDEYYSAPFVWF